MALIFTPLPQPDCGNGELLFLSLTLMLLFPLIALPFTFEDENEAVRFSFIYGLWCLWWGLVGAAYSVYYENLSIFVDLNAFLMAGLGVFVLWRGFLNADWVSRNP